MYVLHRSECTWSRLAKLEEAAEDAGHVACCLLLCSRAVPVAVTVLPVIQSVGLMVSFNNISSHIKQMANRKKSDARECNRMAFGL